MVYIFITFYNSYINKLFLIKDILDVEQVLLSSNIKFITSNSEEESKIKILIFKYKLFNF